MDITEVRIRSIKMLDIAYLGIIYATIAISVSIAIDKTIGEFNKEESDKKSTARIISEIYGNLVLVAVAGYIIRNIVELIPFPLDGYYGFDHKKVKELAGGLTFGFALFYYQTNLRKKIDYLFNDRFKKDGKILTSE